MVSLNFVMMSGNVGSVNIGKTGVGVSAFSMMLAIDQRNNETIWVRVNVYGSLAKKCADKVAKSDYVVVTGELMDRKKSNDDSVFLEVRAKEVIFGSTLMGKELLAFAADTKAVEVEEEILETK
jgi:single-stranded DNA-binding protein